MKKVLAILVLLCVVAAGAVMASYSSDVKGSSKLGQDIEVSIPQGSGANAIGNILADKGIIKSSLFFKLYTKQNPPKSLQYGDFTLNTSMSYEKIIDTLSTVRVKKETISVTFPEGFTLIQFAQRMENNGLCTAEEFIDTANNGDFSQFTFWNKISEHPNKFMKAEGYLYPDTYDFYLDDTVYNMVSKMFANFDSKITDEMYAQMDKIGMSLDEVITLSSFVQEEAGHEKDQPKVAACLRNRIAPDSRQPLLECNVCSYINEPGNYVYDYIVEYYGGVNKVPAGMMDAYNTYAIRGLPPGPISNPGISAITNTLWPADGMDGYYFFVTDVKGNYYYAKTYSQHLANCEVAYSVK